MTAEKHIAYFNTNGKTNYLCLGSQKQIYFEHQVDWSEFQTFLEAQKGRFVYGYISYDAKNSLENLQSTNSDFLHFPTVSFHVPASVIEINDGAMHVIQGAPTEENLRIAKKILLELETPTKNKVTPFQPRIDHQSYINHVNQLKQEIQLGNIYEINFCQEYFSTDNHIKSPKGMYATVNQITKAPFSVYLEEGNHYIMCGSPERYIQKKGNRISSEPIKGTAPRGKTEQEDQQNIHQLCNNPKERSENVMIVDLVRNDLSKIAKKGSVNVDELFGIYTFETVHQMISTISCEVDEQVTFTDIIKATFPMGSMTGAPKVNAMKLSEQHEDFKRGIYAGTIGYILPNGDFDFNVVIRTLQYNAETKYLSCAVGGAITIQCDAEQEFQECETKVRKLIDAVQ